MMHILASTAPICVKQKSLYLQLNAECDKHYYNSLFDGVGLCTNNAVQHPYFECLVSCKTKLAILKVYMQMC